MVTCWSHDLVLAHPVLGVLQRAPFDKLHSNVGVQEVGLDEARREDSALVLQEHHRQQVIANVTLLAHLDGEGRWLNKTPYTMAP